MGVLGVLGVLDIPGVREMLRVLRLLDALVVPGILRVLRGPWVLTGSTEGTGYQETVALLQHVYLLCIKVKQLSQNNVTIYFKTLLRFISNSTLTLEQSLFCGVGWLSFDSYFRQLSIIVFKFPKVNLFNKTIKDIILNWIPHETIIHLG